ncbi:hypothetical protein ACHAW6_015752 [Cyclotella cf. meneghiniana]
MIPRALTPTTRHRHRPFARPLFAASLSASLVATAAFHTASSRPPTRTSSYSLATMEKSNEQSSSTLPPLVDVDCNLMHPDLISVMNSLSTLPPTNPHVPKELQILHHPSTRLANIVAVLSPSSTVDESEASVELLRTTSPRDANRISVKTTAGVHPYHCRTPPTPRDMDRLRALLDRPDHVSCVGETGLDYSPGFPPRELQIEWFRLQLDLASEYGMPVFLHERGAFADLIRCIDEAGRELTDCFTGSRRECEEYVKRGYFISVSGYILREGEEHERVRTCLREGIVPLDRLMIETDAPYMGFVGNKRVFYEAEGDGFSGLSSKKKKRLMSIYPNVPCVLPQVLRRAWEEIRCGREQRGESGVSLEELAEITTQNAKKFFGL